jgi:hypothetical protein
MGRQQHLALGAAARAIIDSNFYMTLGTADEEGRPWVSPVYYAAEGYAKFYWVSSPEATHSRNLAVRPEVSVVIFDSRTPVGSGAHGYRPRLGHRHLLPSVRIARSGRVEPGGRGPVCSPSSVPGHSVGALRARPAGPANTGECVGRVIGGICSPECMEGAFTPVPSKDLVMGPRIGKSQSPSSRPDPGSRPQHMGDVHKDPLGGLCTSGERCSSPTATLSESSSQL